MKIRYLIPLFGILVSSAFSEVNEHPVQDEVFYMLFTDRFYDGDPSNNTGGMNNSDGYDPTVVDFYHGGDLKGVIEKLDYLVELGITAIWLSPVQENFGVQGNISGYHGYWIRDFLNVDPHLGTNQDFKDLVTAAHEKGLKVYMDIVTNHTADMIYFQEGVYSYRSKATHPYLDSEGNEFDDESFAFDGSGDGVFPQMLSESSFPYTPVAHSVLKNPEFLNDLTNYHNRGNSSFSGESSRYGDFYGLDDVFTEKPEVVQGFNEIYSHWIKEYDIDGFRIDTVVHVNIDFWKAFGTAMHQAAKERDEAAEAAGDDALENGSSEDDSESNESENEDENETDGETEEPNGNARQFFMFGEVLDGNVQLLSQFSTTGTIDSTIDFPLAFQIRNWLSQGQDVSVIHNVFADDDYYTDADSHANARPLFLGNHDIGRWGYFINEDNPYLNEADKIKLVELGHACIFFMRGQPIIYYGDEQGFVGTGHFGGSREDMLPSQVSSFNQVDLLGTDSTTADENFDTDHPVFQTLKHLITFYKAHPTLRKGTQITRNADNSNVLALTRYTFDEKTEYIFVANNSRGSTRTVQVDTFANPGQNFEQILTSDSIGQELESFPTVTADVEGAIEVSIPPLSFAIYRASDTIPDMAEDADELSLSFSFLESGGIIRKTQFLSNNQTFPGRAWVTANLNTTQPAKVHFSYSIPDQADLETTDWVDLGTDSNPPYRVQINPALPEGVSSSINLRATAVTIDGKTTETVLTSITIEGN